jgi:hypothetical protein
LKSQVKEFLEATLGSEHQNRMIAIIGISKNAGKTTLLNWLLQETEQHLIGVITTGRDGEDIDLVTHESKPKVSLRANTVFSTFAEEIEKHAPNLEVLEKLSYIAGGRHLWLVKTTSHLLAEIVGPATAEAQAQLANHILSLGAKQVFIDGSIDRKAISLQENVDALVLVVSPAMGNEKDIMKEVTRLYNLSKIPITQEKIKADFIAYQSEKGKWQATEYKSLLGQEQEIIQFLTTKAGLTSIYIPCTITDKGFPMLKVFLQQYKGELIIRHPFMLHISSANLNWLINNCLLTTVNAFHLKALAVNSYAANGKHISSDLLRSEMRSIIEELPVIDVKEILA